jgi:putative tryptophan/tyrosine transport system substrate-binding protein
VIVGLAQKYRMPDIHAFAEVAAVGGLVSYGLNWDDQFRRAAEYVDRILKGAQPAELPVEQPTKFELVVNLKTAKAIGLGIPPTLLTRADRVIE